MLDSVFENLSVFSFSKKIEAGTIWSIEEREKNIHSAMNIMNEGISSMCRIVNGGDDESIRDWGVLKKQAYLNLEVGKICEKMMTLFIKSNSHCVYEVRLFENTCRSHGYDWRWLFKQIRFEEIEGCYFLDSELVDIEDETLLKDIFRIDPKNPSKSEFEVHAVPIVRSINKARAARQPYEEFFLFKFENKENNIFAYYYGDKEYLTYDVSVEMKQLLYQKMLNGPDWDIDLRPPEDIPKDSDGVRDVTKYFSFTNKVSNKKGTKITKTPPEKFSVVAEYMNSSPKPVFLKEIPSTESLNDKMKLDFKNCKKTVGKLKEILTKSKPEILTIQCKQSDMAYAHRYLLDTIDLEKLFPSEKKRIFKLPVYRLRSVVLCHGHKYETYINTENYSDIVYDNEYYMWSNVKGRVLTKSNEWYQSLCAVVYEMSSNNMVE